MKKAALHNLGCKVNSYELEAVRQLLEASGYEIVPFEPGADLYLINTCTVTNVADRKSRQMLHRARKMNPSATVVAMGCYAQIKGKELKKDPAIDIVIGTNRHLDLVRILNRIQEEGTAADAWEDVSREKTYEPLSVTAEESHTRAFIKVQDGCNQFCSYCIIPYARGRIRSRRMEDVIREISGIAEKGTREVVLTGIHLCSYGKDFGGGTDLTDLLEAVNGISGIERIRLGSLEPASISREAAGRMSRLEKLCPHFHLSLQSGSADTLKRMNRGYTPEQYAEICGCLREFFEDPAITTDVITGFPGETEETFRESCEFVEKIGFYETHVFPYSRREGTRAASMPDQVPEAEKKRRSHQLLQLNRRQKAAYMKRHIGRKAKVLLEEKGTMQDGTECWFGYTERYERTGIVSDRDLAGQILEVVPERVVGEVFSVCDGF